MIAGPACARAGARQNPGADAGPLISIRLHPRIKRRARPCRGLSESVRSFGMAWLFIFGGTIARRCPPAPYAARTFGMAQVLLRRRIPVLCSGVRAGPGLKDHAFSRCSTGADGDIRSSCGLGTMLAWRSARPAAWSTGAQKQPGVLVSPVPRYRPPLFFARCPGYVGRHASPETSSTLVLLLEGDPPSIQGGDGEAPGRPHARRAASAPPGPRRTRPQPSAPGTDPGLAQSPQEPDRCKSGSRTGRGLRRRSGGGRVRKGLRCPACSPGTRTNRDGTAATAGRLYVAAGGWR